MKISETFGIVEMDEIIQAGGVGCACGDVEWFGLSVTLEAICNNLVFVCPKCKRVALLKYIRVA